MTFDQLEARLAALRASVAAGEPPEVPTPRPAPPAPVEPEPERKPVAVEPEPEREPVAVAVEPEPEPEPEPVAVEPAPVEPEPELEPEPEPEPAESEHEPAPVPAAVREDRAASLLATMLGVLAVGVSTSAVVVLVMTALLAVVTGGFPAAVRDDAFAPTLVRGDLVWFSDAPTSALDLSDVVRVRVDGSVLVGRPLALNRSLDGSIDDTVTLEVAAGEVTVPAAAIERARLVLPLLGLPALWWSAAPSDAAAIAALAMLGLVLGSAAVGTVQVARRRAAAEVSAERDRVSASA